MINPKFIYLILFCVCSQWGYAQSQVGALDTIPLAEFLEMVKKQYPLYRLAQLQERLGDAKVLEKKGAFDPKMKSSFSQKFFDGKNYYRAFNGQMDWQSPYAFKLSSGADWADGIYLNPEYTFPQQGLFFAGIELPLLSGLFMDEHRAGLRDARLFREMQIQKAFQIRNEVLAEACVVYFQLMGVEEVLRRYESALELSQERFDFTVTAFEQGDVPAIDTLEAFMQYQQRELQVRTAENDFLKSRADVLTLLPQLANEQWQTEDFYTVLAKLPKRDSSFWANTLENHPELLAYQIKMNRLDVERKLIREGFKPQLDVKYNFLNSLNGFAQDFVPNVDANNLGWGLKFSYPILNRKTRGLNQYNKIKTVETQLKLSQKRQALFAKMRATWTVQQNFEDILRDYRILIENYRTLLDAERLQFELGESSLFVVNSRENKLIEAQLKYVELQVKSLVNYIQLTSLSGRLENYLDWVE